MIPVPDSSPLSSDEIADATAHATYIAANSGSLGWSSSDVVAYAESTSDGDKLLRILIRIFLWVLKQLAGGSG